MHFRLIALLLLATSVSAIEKNLRSFNKTAVNGTTLVPRNDVKQYTYNTTSKSLKGVIEVRPNILVTEVSEGIWTITGKVTYPNWISCESDIYRQRIGLVCLVSDGEINPADFRTAYHQGLAYEIICSGNVIDGYWTYKATKPEYYGCAVTNGDEVHYFIDSLISISFPVWAIVVIVIVALLCVCICTCIGYRRYKQ